MLTFPGQRFRPCGRVGRRDFLTIGGLALGGLSLPQILRAEAQSGVRGSHKAVIMVYLNGGPPHQDMFDLKPLAPAEIRGEFHPIATSVPGIEICEHLPRIASLMHRFVPVRSLVGALDHHASHQCVTGRLLTGRIEGGWPGIGSVVSKLRGHVHPSIPPAVDLSLRMAHEPYNIPGAGFLGLAHAPFRPAGEGQGDAEGMANMVLNGITLDRLGDRRRLVRSFDRFRRQADAGGLMEGIDAFSEQAFQILTSGRLVNALDLEQEDPRVRERYGRDEPEALGARLGSLGYQALMSKFLLARRVVEAGARCVTVSFADFDWHGGNFERGRTILPLLDQGLAALVEDLHEHGLDRDVSLVVWGEFGRTPRINEHAGRDHWPRVACALLAGGGMRTGQVLGATNRLAEEPVERPVHFQEVFATLYHNLGIDAARTTIADLNGRPQYLVEDGHRPIRELV